MITLLPLRVDAATPRSRLLDAALASAIARTAEKLAAARPPSTLDAITPIPIITHIRSS